MFEAGRSEDRSDRGVWSAELAVQIWIGIDEKAVGKFVDDAGKMTGNGHLIDSDVNQGDHSQCLFQ